MRQVAGHGVRDVVARSTELAAAVEEGLRRVVVVRARVRVGAHADVVADQDHHPAAVVALGGRALVVRKVGRVLNARMLTAVGVHEAVALVARDAACVVVAHVGAVGRGRATPQPAVGDVAAQAEVARSVEVLLADRHRRPEQGIGRCLRHQAAAPVVRRLDFERVATVAVVALLRRAQAPDLVWLRAGELDFGGNFQGRQRDGSRGGDRQEEATQDERCTEGGAHTHGRTP